MQFPFIWHTCSASSFVEVKALDEERARVRALPTVYLAPTESKYKLFASTKLWPPQTSIKPCICGKRLNLGLERITFNRTRHFGNFAHASKCFKGNMETHMTGTFWGKSRAILKWRTSHLSQALLGASNSAGDQIISSKLDHSTYHLNRHTKNIYSASLTIASRKLTFFEYQILNTELPLSIFSSLIPTEVK